MQQQVRLTQAPGKRRATGMQLQPDASLRRPVSDRERLKHQQYSMVKPGGPREGRVAVANPYNSPPLAHSQWLRQRKKNPQTHSKLTRNSLHNVPKETVGWGHTPGSFGSRPKPTNTGIGKERSPENLATRVSYTTKAATHTHLQTRTHTNPQTQHSSSVTHTHTHKFPGLQSPTQEHTHTTSAHRGYSRHTVAVLTSPGIR